MTIDTGIVQKLWCGDGNRLSRFHTVSGARVGARALVDLVPAMWSWFEFRMTGRRRMQPWWVYSAIRDVDRLIQPNDMVLEVGGGCSTPWLAKRCRRVLTLEEDEFWGRRIESFALRESLDNVEVTIVKIESAFDQVLASEQWDVVIIDGSRSRRMLFEATTVIAKPRIIVLDDTDRAENKIDTTVLNSAYKIEKHIGFKPQTLHACETSIVFMRP